MRIRACQPTILLPWLCAGEALSLSNHVTRVETPCLRAPPAGTIGPGGLPSWALPVAVLLTAGDAASSLIDPALPYIAAGAVVATLATGARQCVDGCLACGVATLGRSMLQCWLEDSACEPHPPSLPHSTAHAQAWRATACCCRGSRCCRSGHWRCRPRDRSCWHRWGGVRDWVTGMEPSMCVDAGTQGVVQTLQLQACEWCRLHGV